MELQRSRQLVSSKRQEIAEVAAQTEFATEFVERPVEEDCTVKCVVVSVERYAKRCKNERWKLAAQRWLQYHAKCVFPCCAKIAKSHTKARSVWNGLEITRSSNNDSRLRQYGNQYSKEKVRSIFDRKRCGVHERFLLLGKYQYQALN